MSDKGLGNDFRLPSAAEIEEFANKVVRQLGELRDELGRNHEEFTQNIQISKILGTFLAPKPDAIERRKKIMDKMSEEELTRAIVVARSMAAELDGYQLWRAKQQKESGS